MPDLEPAAHTRASITEAESSLPPRAKKDRRRAQEEENLSKGRVAAASDAVWKGRISEATADLAEAATLVPAANLARAEAALASIDRPVQTMSRFVDLVFNPMLWMIRLMDKILHYPL